MLVDVFHATFLSRVSLHHRYAAIACFVLLVSLLRRIFSRASQAKVSRDAFGCCSANASSHCMGQGVPCIGVTFEQLEPSRRLRARVCKQPADGNCFWQSVARKSKCWRSEKRAILSSFGQECACNASLQRHEDFSMLCAAVEKGRSKGSWANNELVAVWAAEQQTRLVICKDMMPWCVITPSHVTRTHFVEFNGHHYDRLVVPHSENVRLSAAVPMQGPHGSPARWWQDAR
eukprot:986786-Amphidinium_carterae.1